MPLNASDELSLTRLSFLSGEQGINSQSSPNLSHKLLIEFSSRSSKSLLPSCSEEALMGAINCFFTNSWAWVGSRRVANGLFRICAWLFSNFASNQSSLQWEINSYSERLLAKVDLPAPDLPINPQHKSLTATALAWNTNDPLHARSKGVIWFLIKCSQRLRYFGSWISAPKYRTASLPCFEGVTRKLSPSSKFKMYSAPDFDIVRCKDPFSPCCWRIYVETIGLNNFLGVFELQVLVKQNDTKQDLSKSFSKLDSATTSLYALSRSWPISVILLLAALTLRTTSSRS